MNIKPQTIAIIQARMGSSRLPGKVLMPILKKPVLWHVYQRTKRARGVDKVIIATSDKKADDKIAKFCEKNNMPLFRGSENDVLDRYFQAAKQYGAAYIVRVTADCPLVDPELIDKTIKLLLKGNYDHVGIATGAGVAKSKVIKFPDGLDCSVFTFKSLEHAEIYAKNQDEREHVDMFIWKRPRIFKLANLCSDIDYSDLRLTIDYKEDLALVRKIYQKLYSSNHHFSLSDIISFIKANPKLLNINSKYIGKEGYLELWRSKKGN